MASSCGFCLLDWRAKCALYLCSKKLLYYTGSHVGGKRNIKRKCINPRRIKPKVKRMMKMEKYTKWYLVQSNIPQLNQNTALTEGHHMPAKLQNSWLCGVVSQCKQFWCRRDILHFSKMTDQLTMEESGTYCVIMNKLFAMDFD